ncbi:MAG: hypothetical protein ACXW3F_10040 [Pyrinomonadaceae bacterium]
MNLVRKITLGLLAITFGLGSTGSASSALTRNFDEFGDINCEDEMARLDNFAVNLQNSPADKGVIIFYGGRRFRKRLPKRGDAAARAARLKTYLTQRRGIPTDQVIVIDGGYREGWYAELWIAPAGADLPVGRPTIPIKEIKFRKGKAHPRDFRCQI